MKELDQEKLKKIIDYDSSTGKITRLDRKGGDGSYDKEGYLIIKIKGKQYKSHRLAWLYIHGKFPIYFIDHKNGEKADNRIANLRDVPPSLNNRNTNKKINEDTKVNGVYLDKCTKGLKSRYVVRMGGVCRRFRDIKDAIKYRAEKEVELGYYNR